MAYIKTIPPHKATGETAEVYQYMFRLTGFIKTPNLFKVLSLEPAGFKRIIRGYELTMWMSDQPRARLEMVATMVSRLNDCPY